MEDRHAALKLRSRIRSLNRRLAKNSADPGRGDRSLWAELALVNFASVTGLTGDVEIDPETVLCDLLADLMHWCDVQKANNCPIESIDFESALERARDHYRKECAERGAGGMDHPYAQR